MSLKLYLLRHAEAEKGADDFERPLTAHGKAQALWIGCYLLKQQERPQSIICSSALRAFTTARLVAKRLQLPDDALTPESSMYNADYDTLLSLFHNFNENQVLFVGHNPAISQLAYYLTGDDRLQDSLSPCGLCVIEFPVSDWADITEQSGHLISCIEPELSDCQ